MILDVQMHMCGITRNVYIEFSIETRTYRNEIDIANVNRIGASGKTTGRRNELGQKKALQETQKQEKYSYKAILYTTINMTEKQTPLNIRQAIYSNCVGAIKDGSSPITRKRK